MTLGKCPTCGSGEVRYAAAWPANMLRRLKNSRKRHCLACGGGWHVDQLAPLRILKLMDYELAAIAVIGIGGIILIDRSFRPIYRTKTVVRAYYDRKYGNDSRDRLWRHFGFIYPSKKEARKDYDAHLR